MDLAEIYARRIAQTGYFAGEEPTDHLLPGDYGFFDHAVFRKVGSLSANNYNYALQATGASQKALMSSGMVCLGVAGGADAGDPTGTALVGAKVSYQATRADEALLVMRGATAWTVRDLEALLRQIKSNLGRFMLNTVIVNEVVATEGGFRLISSSAGQSIKVGFEAGSKLPTMTVDGRAAIQFGSRSQMSVGDSFWAPKADANKMSSTIPPAAGQACMPVFRSGFRVKRKHWRLFGRDINLRRGRELDTLTGEEVLLYPADHELQDFRPGARLDATTSESLGPSADPDVYTTNEGELENLGVWDVFEVVGPDQIVNEHDLLTALVART